MQKSGQLFVYFIIPLLFFSGIVLTSFSDEPKEIQIQIEPPQEEFEDVTKEEEPEPESQPENSGGGGNGPMVYVTGSNYALTVSYTHLTLPTKA